MKLEGDRQGQKNEKHEENGERRQAKIEAEEVRGGHRHRIK